MSKRTVLFIAAAAVFIAIISSFQTFVYLINTPVGKYFPLVHNFEEDYYYYLSYIRQGIDGNLFGVNLYSPDILKPNLLYVFFPISGLLMSFTGLDPQGIYLFLRIIFGAGLLMAAYFYFLKAFSSRKKALMALILSFSFVPYWYFSQGKLLISGGFWTGLDPFMRITFLPHHIFANLMFFASLYFFIRSLQENKLMLTVISAVLAFLCGLSNSGVLMVLYFSVIGVTTGYFKTKSLFKSFVFFLISALALVFIQLAVLEDPVWQYFASLEKSYAFGVRVNEYLLWGGLTGILAPFGIGAIMNKNPYLRALAFWFIAPLVLNLFSRFLPMSNFRYYQSAHYFAGGGLALYFIYMLSSFFNKAGLKRKLLYAILIIFPVLYSLPSYMASANRQLEYISLNSGKIMIYPDKELINVLDYLDKSGQPKDLVITRPDLGIFVPAFSNKKVYYGHGVLTYRAGERLAFIQSVLKEGSIDTKRLKEENVKYILADEGDMQFEKNPFLDSVYRNAGYRIYKIKY